MEFVKRYKVLLVTSIVVVAIGVAGIICITQANAEPSSADQIKEQVTDQIPSGVKEAAEGEIEVYSGDDVSQGDIYVGTSFPTYYVGSDGENDEGYFCPLIDKGTNKVVDVVVVGEIKGEFRCSGSVSDLVDGLNKIDYPDNPCIFYADADVVVADNGTEITVLYGDATDKIKAFENENFSEKVEAISNMIAGWKAVDTPAPTANKSENFENILYKK